MKKVVYSVPNMYADHHVTAVLKALAGLDGIKDVKASAGFQELAVEYDAKTLSPSAVEKCLKEAGYPPGEAVALEYQRASGDPAWGALGLRSTRTDRRDIEMSGEFRKY